MNRAFWANPACRSAYQRPLAHASPCIFWANTCIIRGFVSLPVHFLGKAATFCLLYAFPLVLLGAGNGEWHLLARIVGWAFACWGAGMYWWAGLMYVKQTLDVARSFPRLDRTASGSA